MSFNQLEKVVLVRETPQAIPEIQQKEDEKSVKRGSILTNETQTHVVLDTKKIDGIAVIPETQIDVIVIDN